MSDWTSISLTEEQKATINEAKPEGMTTGTFIVQSIESNSNESGAIDSSTIQNMRDEIMASVSAECGDVATVEDISDLVRRIEDLESRLPRKVAEELR